MLHGKAILSGQIYEGRCDGRYTDDYAYDAAVGFRSGVRLYLPSFAKELIESPSGWRVYADHTDGDQVQLSIGGSSATIRLATVPSWWSAPTCAS